MKAVRFHEHGGVEVLRYEDVPEPGIKGNEVLVRVRACALNHLDLWVRQGLPGVKVPLPHISGSDIAGEVAQAGELVTRVRVGDKVVIAPGLSCGQCRECLSGRDNLCRFYDIIGGYKTDGGYAEYVKVPEVNALPIPGGLSFEEAACVPLVFLTAWHMLVGRGGIKPGDDVLVVAAGSGVGSAAVQIAKLFGARVIATAGSDEKLKKAQELGADEVINHTSQDIAEEVRRLTGKRGVDIIFEHVGQAVWDQCIRSLAPGGRLITCGATSGFQCPTDVRYLFMKDLAIMGSYMGGKGELLEVLQFIERGKLRPVLDRTFPLKEAARAQQLLEERKHFGKLVLIP